MKNALRMLGNVAVRVFHSRSRSFLQRLFFVEFLVFSCLLLAFNFAFYIPNSLAAVNQQINYQGKLTNSSNVAVSDGSYIMKFRLYTSASSATTTAVWEEIRTATGDLASVTNGLFSVMLGSTTPLTSINFNQTLYLGVEVCGTVSLAGCDGEMTPRKVLGASPAAIVATYVSGSATPSSFGTTTPLANTQVTIEATTTTAIPLTIRAAASQSVNLFNVQNSAVSPLFFINSSGALFASSTLQVTATTTLYGDLTVSGSLLVNNATSTITNLVTVNATSTNATTTTLYVSGSATTTFGGGITLATGGNLNLATGGSYLINNANVLSATTLGASVVNSSLTSVGTLGSLTVSGLASLNGQASTTRLSVFDLAYFGGTATSTFNSSGDLLVMGSTTLQNFTGKNATTTNATTTNQAITGLATAAGTFLAADPTGRVIATTTPTSGSSNWTDGGIYLSPLTTTDGILITAATSTITNLVMVNATSTNATTTTLYVLGAATSTFGGGLNLTTGNVNLPTGGSYLINNVNVLSATTLGAAVVNSSLTGVGTIGTGIWRGTAVESQYGGTGQNFSAGNGWLNVSAGVFTASTSPTVNWITATSTTATSTFSTGGFTIGTSQFIVQQNSGFVGIGTTTPSDSLTVYNGSFRQAPGNPTQVGSVDLGSAPVATAVAGNYVYEVDQTALKVIDVSDSTKPKIISSLNVVGTPVDIAVAGRYAYTIGSGGTKAFRIFDLTNPGLPAQVGLVAVSLGGNTPQAVAVAGRYAYEVGGGALSIIDISNPAAPVLAINGFLFGGGGNGDSGPNDIFVAGRYAYVTDSADTSLYIIDISNPVAPLVTGSSGVDYPMSVAVAGRYAYVTGITAPSDHLTVIDVATSSAPVSVGSLTLGSNPTSYHNVAPVAVAGRYAYIINPATGMFRVVDIASSTAPVQVGSLGSVFGSSLAVAGRYAYEVSGSNLKIIDLSGLEVTSGIIHSLEAGTLQVRQDSYFDQNLSIRGGLNIGTGGVYSSGPISVSVASTTQTNPVSAYFQGNVGIGTTSPYAALSVVGASGVVAGKFTATSTTATSTLATGGFTIGASQFIVQQTSGFVGIGTTAPLRTLDVTGNWGGNSVIYNGTEIISINETVWNKALVYHLTNDMSAGLNNNSYSVTVVYNITGLSDTEGAFAYIYTFAKKGLTDYPLTSTVTIQINGAQVSTVSTPSQTEASQIFESYVVAYSNNAWHIIGAPSTTNLADLAEWIEYEGEKPVAGELVSFGSEPVKVRRTATAYDQNLIGIVSTNPHTVMGGETSTSIKLSLAGRVPVKVSSENGPIKIGDYLTSSSIPGVTMKATQAGRVVGRALEPFSGVGGGIGQVLVLVEAGDWPGPNLADVLNTLTTHLTALEMATPIAPSFFDNLFRRITGWFADVTNGIGDLFANTFRAKEKVCIGATCLDEAALKSLLSNINIQPELLPVSTPVITATSTATTTEETATSSPVDTIISTTTEISATTTILALPPESEPTTEPTTTTTVVETPASPPEPQI